MSSGQRGGLADRKARHKGVIFEQKPIKRSPAHKSDGFAELVFQLLRAADIHSGGPLKQEMRELDSLVMRGGRYAGTRRRRAGGGPRGFFGLYHGNA